MYYTFRHNVIHSNNYTHSLKLLIGLRKKKEKKARKKVYKFNLILSCLLSGYYIHWNQRWIHVFRPDVECINGIIHVIDRPLLEENEIYVGGFNAAKPVCSTGVVVLLISAVGTLLM